MSYRMWRALKLLRAAVLGCPVCGRRRRHRVFCRYGMLGR